MHIAVTDLLTCPACGPAAGLVLLADEIADRRVVTGTLGCALCRTKYAIRRGVARLDAPAGAGAADAVPASGGGGIDAAQPLPGARLDRRMPPADGADARAPGVGADEPMRWAALLGISDGPGHLLIVGPAAACAAAVADIVADVEVIAATNTDGEIPDPAPRVSVLRIGGELPLCGGRIRGVAVSGSAADRMLESAARAVAVGGRLVLRPAPADADARLAHAGMQVLARQNDTLVAQRG